MQDIEFGGLGLKNRIQKILILGFLLMGSVSFSGCPLCQDGVRQIDALELS